MEDDDVVNMKDPHVPDYIGDGEDGLKYGVEETFYQNMDDDYALNMKDADEADEEDEEDGDGQKYGVDNIEEGENDAS